MIVVTEQQNSCGHCRALAGESAGFPESAPEGTVIAEVLRPRTVLEPAAERVFRPHLQLMRISVPTIPSAVISTSLSTKTISKAAAAERIAAFLAPGNVATITGAGVSVDSGIRAYRGAKGIYLNPNYK